MMESSSFRHLSASRISFVMLGSGGSACWRILLTVLLIVSACSASSCLTADSALAIISVVGMFSGVTAKFRPFFSRAISVSLRDLEDKLITQLVLSTDAHNTGHYLLWDEVKFIDRDPHWYTLRVKEAIHIRLHPNNINSDSGIEIPEAWMSTIKKHNNRRATEKQATEGAANRNSEDRNAPITAAENQPIIAEHHVL